MGNKNAAEQKRKGSILLIKPMNEFDYEGTRVSMSCQDSTTTLSLAISNNLPCCDKLYFEFLVFWTNVWESYHWLIWWGILALTAKVKPDVNPYKQMPKDQKLLTAETINPIEDGHFQSCSQMGAPPLLKIGHKYPTIMKLGTVIL